MGTPVRNRRDTYDKHETGDERPAAGVDDFARWELLRALGAVSVTPPPHNALLCASLDIPAPSGAQHTDVFLLTAPPHASIHLGPEGQLGGEGLDRVAGFWRALGLRAPEDADHLGVLLMLYAQLGDCESTSPDSQRVRQMARSRTALFHEHIWSWAPGYLSVVADLAVPPLAIWADLTLAALQHEASMLEPPDTLPLALREAPPPLGGDSLDEMLDAVLTPVRSGIILTQRDLMACAVHVGAGFRRGERKFALRALIHQEPALTLAWLAATARDWTTRHRPDPSQGNDPRQWWRQRAGRTAEALEGLRDAAPRVAGEETTT